MFSEWFHNHVLSSSMNDNVIRTLAFGPSKNILTWEQYYVNGFKFEVESRGKYKSTYNYGVMVSLTDGGKDYYGTLQQIIEIDYYGDARIYKAVLLKCHLFDSNNGLNVHPVYKIVEINHKKKHRVYDPFVLAYQAQQVCFTPFPSTKCDRADWWTMFKIKARHIIDEDLGTGLFQENVDHSEEAPSLSEPDVTEEAQSDEDLDDDIEDEEQELFGLEDNNEEELADTCTESDEDDNNEVIPFLSSDTDQGISEDDSDN